jgi:hypothetical protein
MKTTITALGGFAASLMVLGICAVAAAPNIPSSELPGRERQRFLESPVERFTDPLASPRNAEPTFRWKCDERKPQQGQQRSKRDKDC